MKGFSFILLFILSGCGFQKLAVTQIDNLIEIQTASRLDLYHAQKKVLEKDVTLFLEDQKIHLPRLKALLRKVDPTQMETLPQIWEEGLREFRRVALAYSVILAKHLVGLDFDQRKNFFSKQKIENEQIAERNQQQTVDKLSERVEYFFGETSEQQRKVLKNYLPEFKRRGELRIERRERLHKRLDSILNSESTVQKDLLVMAAFESYQMESSQDQGPLIALIQNLCSDLTKKQLKAFKQKRAEIIELVELFEGTKY